MKKNLPLIAAGTVISAAVLAGCIGSVPASGAGGSSTTPTKSEASLPLNDTGITLCGDYAYGASNEHDNAVDCSLAGGVDGDGDGDSVPAEQDGNKGRDVTHNDNADGHAGFSFTKLDASGNDLAASAGSWSCVKDNVTGLIWEVKTGSGLHNKNHTYTWYSYSSANNGGLAGTSNGGSCSGGTACDTDTFVADVNVQGLCGENDWRLPSKNELLSLINYSRFSPAIDVDYFANTEAGDFWSMSPSAGESEKAWAVDFTYGYVEEPSSKASARKARLVRNP
ncbi:MAG: DUF1566 domain-containing protein [Pseudomonadales bacterium]|nr:DUF1566 domain-containing protein [Pseudomonadales bacterium]